MRLALLLLAMLSAPAFALAGEACATDRVDLRGEWGTARFSVELADTPGERAQGLMFRDSLSASHGMLFMYQIVGRPAFWMKNTLIPLDMLFVTPQGRVQYVHENAVPGDLSPIEGGPGILAVLEIRGGMARLMGIAEGTELRHPAFDASIALWPCDETD